LTSTLTELNAGGRTIILTTHDLDRAPDAATQYMVIVNGSIRAAGARAELPEQALRVAYERAVARQDLVQPESGEG
jgi:ABC-type multidrug transport system ATPase subunit